MISLPLNSVLLPNFSFMNRCISLLSATESTSMGSKPYRFFKIYILHKHQLFFIVHVYLRTEYFQIQYYIQLAQTRHIYVGQNNSSFNYLTTLLSHILGTVPGNLYSEIKDSQFQTNHFLKEKTEKATRWDFFLSRRKIRILSRHTELCSKPSSANKGLANKRRKYISLPGWWRGIVQEESSHKFIKLKKSINSFILIYFMYGS